ncbi:MAG: FKBP-type peptidyl-prolyl cis-trans isomerase [Sphingobacteriaceae bacterium]|nr:FKBP-type peptidyl-prolyl cis-trans isomerase [Sphingobacteriaceae bacterium]
MKFNLRKLYYFLTLTLIVFSSCKKEYESIEELDENNIQQYLKDNNITAKRNAQGIYFLSTGNRGAGAKLEYNEKIPLVYTIRSLDGQFSSLDTFVNRYGGSGKFLGYLSPAGLRDAVKDSLKRGGFMKIIIPSHLAYGRGGSGQIPGNASLEYTVRALNEGDLQAYDRISIEKYIAANNLTGFSSTTTGIHYKIIGMGTGSPINKDSTLTVTYTGRLFNGKVFQQATDNNQVVLPLSETIEGWIQTLPLIKGGGTIRVLIPSALAYGIDARLNNDGSTAIPPFSCLDFEIKVVDVAKE